MFYVELLNPCYSYSSIEDSQSEEPVENIVFSYPGNEVIEAIKNTKQNRDGLYKYNIDRHQEL